MEQQQQQSQLQCTATVAVTTTQANSARFYAKNYRETKVSKEKSIQSAKIVLSINDFFPLNCFTANSKSDIRSRTQETETAADKMEQGKRSNAKEKESREYKHLISMMRNTESQWIWVWLVVKNDRQKLTVWALWSCTCTRVCVCVSIRWSIQFRFIVCFHCLCLSPICSKASCEMANYIYIHSHSHPYPY